MLDARTITDAAAGSVRNDVADASRSVSLTDLRADALAGNDATPASATSLTTIHERCQALWESGQREEAAARLDAAIDRGPTADLSALADVLRWRLQLNQRREAARTMLALSAGLKLTADGWNRDDDDSVIEALADELTPGTAGHDATARALLALAEHAERSHKVRAAVSLYIEAFQRDPLLAAAAIGACRCLLHRGRHQQCVDIAKAAMPYLPEEPALYRYAGTGRLMANAVHSAVRYLQRWLEMEPNWLDELPEIGMQLIQRDKLHACLALYRLAVRRLPRDCGVLNCLAMIHVHLAAKLQQFEPLHEAVALLGDSLEQNPEQPQARETMVGLQTLGEAGLEPLMIGEALRQSEVDRGAKLNLFAVLAWGRPFEASNEGNASRLILVVDDDPTLRFLVSHALKGHGFVVCEAANGDEALEQFDRLVPDLVIVDGMMPGSDGFRVCEIIREKSAQAQSRLIMISGLSDRHVRDHAERSGADAFLPKPIRMPKLIAEVERQLAHLSA